MLTFGYTNWFNLNFRMKKNYIISGQKKKKRKKEGKRKRKERNKRRGTKHSSFCKYQNYPAITSR